MNKNTTLVDETMHPILSVNNLSVDSSLASGNVRILTDISFDLAKGEVLGVIGESGAGLTVLSRAIMNWMPNSLEITNGEIEFRSRNLLCFSPVEMSALRGKEIAYIGSDSSTALNPTVPIGRHLVSKLRSVMPEYSEQEAQKRVIDLFDAVRIPSPRLRFNEFPFQFSGGMMQRVMIVDALCSDPALLVADNVTQPLDVTVAKQIVRLLHDLRDDFGTSVVFSTASLPMAGDISERLLVLQKGKLLEQTTPKDVVENPNTEYTKTLTSRVPRIWNIQHTPQKSVSMKPILSVRDVSKTYHTKNPKAYFSKQAVQAVRGVSFDVLEGENFGIVGESGCGKSTLAKVLLGLETATDGEISLNGEMVQDIPVQSRSSKQLAAMQMVFQNPSDTLNPSHTVGQQIGRAITKFGVETNRKKVREIVMSLLDVVKLPRDFYYRRPRQLSGGQKQRIGIARAFAGRPSMIIADEPVSALDVSVAAAITELLMDLQRERKMTLLFISHDLSIVRYLSDRILVMYLGQVMEQGKTRDVFQPPYHPYTEALLSAVPIADPDVSKREIVLDGNLPSVLNPPRGCPFETRCPRKIGQICEDERPPVQLISDNHQIACHIPLDELKQVEPVIEMPAVANASMR